MPAVSMVTLMRAVGSWLLWALLPSLHWWCSNVSAQCGSTALVWQTAPLLSQPLALLMDTRGIFNGGVQLEGHCCLGIQGWYQD